MDAAQEENKGPTLRGRAYDRQFMNAGDLPQTLEQLDRSKIYLEIFDPVSGQTVKQSISADQFGATRLEVQNENLHRASRELRNSRRVIRSFAQQRRATRRAKGFEFLQRFDTNKTEVTAMQSRIDDLSSKIKTSGAVKDLSETQRLDLAAQMQSLDGLQHELQARYTQILGGHSEWENLAKLLHPPDPDEMRFVYGIKPDGQMPVAPEVDSSADAGRPSHSELAQGQNIYGGGELIFKRDSATNKWYLQEINNATWHYRAPEKETLAYAEHVLKENTELIQPSNAQGHT